MPYEVKQSSKGYCVHKQDGSPVPGGCHTSKSKALRHMRALYANEPRAARESLVEASKEHTGVMVALPVPEMYRPLFIALQSLLPRGSELVPPDDLHLTLLYLGDSSSLESSKTSIFAGALNAVEWQQGIVGTLTGLARFNNDESGRNALVLLVDSPLLPGFRHNVWAQVTQRDVSGEQRHGFIPHITLGYIPVDAKTPQIPVPPIKIVFDSYVVAWGDEHLAVPLSGVMTKAVSLKHGSHNQAAHGNRYGRGFGATKRQFARLDKVDREKFKAEARRRRDAAQSQSQQASGTERIVEMQSRLNEIRRMQDGSTGPFHRDLDTDEFTMPGGAAIRDTLREEEYSLLSGIRKETSRLLAINPSPELAREIMRLTALPTDLTYPALSYQGRRKEMLSFALLTEEDFNTAALLTDAEWQILEEEVKAEEDKENTKADGKGYGARAGEKISGNLTRGNDGKFASAGESSDSAPEPAKPPTQRRQRLGRTEAANERAKLERRESKRRATASESERKRQARSTATAKRRQEVAARRAAAKRAKQEESERGRQANRKAVLDATGIKEDTLKALERFAAGGEIDPNSELAGILKSMNLIATTGDGGLKMGSAGRSLLAAIKSGDIRQAKDAVASGREAVGKRRAARIREEDKAEKEASLSVFKDATGRFRWVLLSSNAYRDRDGEIVSIKALTEDVARADVDKDFGPLRWWHVPGLDIGDCDFNAMSGRMLVESGTFRSEAIGQSVYKAQKDLQASIGFRHPHTEPDREKVYHRIRRFERSLTPVGRASNPFTRLMVKQEGMMEDSEKLEQFKAMLGDEVVQQFLAQIQATQKEADEKSTYKSEEPTATMQAVLTPADVASYITANNNPVSVGSTNAGATFTVEATDEGSPLYAGDLSPDDLVERVASRVLQGMLPLFGGMVEQVKALATSQKSDDIALLQEQQARKEAESAKARQALQEQANALATQLKEVKTKLDELTGEQPRALQQGYRASQQNPISDNHRLKEAAPAGGLDPNFFSDFLGGKSNLPPV